MKYYQLYISDYCADHEPIICKIESVEKAVLNKTALKHNSILDKLTYAQSIIKDSQGAINELHVTNKKGKPFLKVVADQLGNMHYYCYRTNKRITNTVLKAQGVVNYG